MIRTLKLAGLVLAGLVLAVIGGGLSKALAESNTPTGITVSPAFQQVTINAGQTEVPIKFSVTNDRPVAQILSLSTADFNTLGESGGVLFAGSNPTELQKKYGLAKYISLPSERLTLRPGQTQIINASILNLPALSSGGHYGALMLAVDSTDLGPAANSVGVHPVASSLLFVTKLGGDTHKLALAGVSHSHSFLKLPGSVTLKFKNNGNTHLIPRGTITVIDGKGKLISKGIINDNSGIILPETFRSYTVPLQNLQSVNLASKYTMNVAYRFDGFDQFRTYEERLTLLPVFNLLALLVGLVVLVLVIAKTNLRRRFANLLARK